MTCRMPRAASSATSDVSSSDGIVASRTGRSERRPYFASSDARSIEIERRRKHDPAAQTLVVGTRGRQSEPREAAQREVDLRQHPGRADVARTPAERRPEHDRIDQREQRAFGIGRGDDEGGRDLLSAGQHDTSRAVVAHLEPGNRCAGPDRHPLGPRSRREGVDQRSRSPAGHGQLARGARARSRCVPQQVHRRSRRADAGAAIADAAPGDHRAQRLDPERVGHDIGHGRRGNAEQLLERAPAVPAGAARQAEAGHRVERGRPPHVGRAQLAELANDPPEIAQLAVKSLEGVRFGRTEPLPELGQGPGRIGPQGQPGLGLEDADGGRDEREPVRLQVEPPRNRR